jgi:hypothetical protein
MFETQAQVFITDILYLEFYMYIGIKIRMEGIYKPEVRWLR